MKNEGLWLWLLTGDRDELDVAVLQQHGSTAVLVEDERSRGLSCSVDGDLAQTRRRGRGHGCRTRSRCFVTAATLRLPRCRRGGDRGEHAAKGSGGVSARWLYRGEGATGMAGARSMSHLGEDEDEGVVSWLGAGHVEVLIAAARDVAVRGQGGDRGEPRAAVGSVARAWASRASGRPWPERGGRARRRGLRGHQVVALGLLLALVTTR